VVGRSCYLRFIAIKFYFIRDIIFCDIWMDCASITMPVIYYSICLRAKLYALNANRTYAVERKIMYDGKANF